MKKLLAFVIFTAVLVKVNGQQLASTQSIIDAACRQAAQQHKNVFVIFHASWCGWCRKMDSSMNTSALKPFFNGNYVIQHVTVFENDSTFDNPGAKDFLTAHNAADQGIPAWFIIDGNGKLLADSYIRKTGQEGVNVGCPAEEQEIQYFIKVLETTSDISNKEKASVVQIFQKNKF